MNKLINIAKSKKAIEQITVFKENLYENTDIRFINVHLRRLNEILDIELFSKNDLFINSKTLWEIMQPIGKSDSHNYHDLAPEDIYNAIKLTSDPECVIKVKLNRYAIIPVYLSSYNLPLMVVIEVGAGLVNDKNANINKIVTIYPKDNLDKLIDKTNKKDILFIKK